MKNTRIKDKAVELASKALLLAVSILVCLWMISGARAATPQIQDLVVTDQEAGATKVELKLSSAVARNNVSVDFERNFIQVSFHGVSAFPAKNKNVGEEVLEKIFTYQYQPDLARVRLLLRSEASKVKAATTWHLIGNSLVITIPGKDSSATAAAAPKADSVKQISAVEEKPDLANQAAEAQILKEVTTGKTEKSAEKTAKLDSKGENEPLFLGESTEKVAKPAAASGPTPFQKMISGLFTVLVIIGSIALAFRKFVLGKGLKIGSLNFARGNRMIDVVSTQGLGPKKSLSVVRVADQYIVIGVTGDNINFLTNLDSKANVEKYLDIDEVQTDQVAFSSTLNNNLNTNVTFKASSDTLPEKTPVAASIRSSIKKRIEGFKPL